jgi:hypothetical protein
VVVDRTTHNPANTTINAILRSTSINATPTLDSDYPASACTSLVGPRPQVGERPVDAGNDGKPELQINSNHTNHNGIEFGH